VTSNTSYQRDVETASSLNARLGLRFENLSLLTRALTHRSYINENPDALEDNERLEFLGDAVLDFMVGEWAYHHFPEMPEGTLTKIRSYLVRNERLAEFSSKLNLGSALRLGRGEKTSGGHLRASLLGSTFEALIGAIYLDSNIEKVKAFVLPMFDAIADSILEAVEDEKSELQEITQALKLGMPQYQVVQASGPDHAKTYAVQVLIAGIVEGSGTGTSISLAERSAAREALKKFKSNPKSEIQNRKS
jgi:ribonuclease III